MRKKVKFKCLKLSEGFGIYCEVTPTIIDFESSGDFIIDHVPNEKCPYYTLQQCPCPNDCYMAKGQSKDFFAFDDPHCIV